MAEQDEGDLQYTADDYEDYKEHEWLLEQDGIKSDENLTFPIKPSNIESWLKFCKMLQEHFIRLQQIPEWDSNWAHGEEKKTSNFIKDLQKRQKGYNKSS